MKRSELPSPAEARESSVDEDILAGGRARLRQAMRRSQGKGFTYAASLFPEGTADTLIGEIRNAGWTCKLVSDSKDGDYYKISPK